MRFLLWCGYVPAEDLRESQRRYRDLSDTAHRQGRHIRELTDQLRGLELELARMARKGLSQ